MAEFRKWIYALAVVALIAGFTVPASAQSAPFQCTVNAGTPPVVRAQGLAELMGDLVLNCTGGTPTVAGQAVPTVNITIGLGVNITSKATAGVGTGNVWNEALLIFDEPHSATKPGNQLLNCGATGAPDSGVSGPGVCGIVEPAAGPAFTYDGATGAGTCPTPATPTFSCGHPNVFQARYVAASPSNQIVFLGIPLDPPGTGTSRTLRFTNIRGNATQTFLGSTLGQTLIQANIAINGNTAVTIANPQTTLAYVQNGIVGSVFNTNSSYLQCTTEASFNTIPSVTQASATNNQRQGSQQGYRFTEGFATSFKAKNVAHVINQSGNAGNGTFTNGAYYTYNLTTSNYPTDLNQNVPGAIYNTESGFESPTGQADPSPNPPLGMGNGAVTVAGIAFSSGATGISNAGIATQGTRLMIQIGGPIPTGTTLYTPTIVYLYRVGGTGLTSTLTASITPNAAYTTGVARLVNTNSNGVGAYSAGIVTTTGANDLQAVNSTNTVVYEVLDSDPNSVEATDIPVVVAYTSLLSTNSPQTGQFATAVGGFAPLDSTGVGNTSTTVPVPRFIPGPATPGNLFSIQKCACNLLFPYVTSQGGFDTGLAIANTSLDNLGAAGASAAVKQDGTIQFWYYGIMGNGGAAPSSQTSTVLTAGQVLGYDISGSNPALQGGLDARAGAQTNGGFTGYIIAQAQFQYCHGFAYVTQYGNPFSAASEGYLGLLLDNLQINNGGSFPITLTSGSGGSLVTYTGSMTVGAAGLSRTNLKGENLVH